MVDINKGLDKFFHSLIPAPLRESLVITSWIYLRVRILSAMLCIATLMCVVCSIILVSIHALFYPEQLKYDSVILAITVGFGFQTWIFYKFCNYGVSGLMLSYFYFLSILLFILVTGSYDSPVLILLVLSPIVFFMVGGIRDGIQNSLFVIVIGTVLGVLKAAGIQLPSLFSDTTPLLTDGMVWVISVASIAICVMAYDTELQKRG